MISTSTSVQMLVLTLSYSINVRSGAYIKLDVSLAHPWNGEIIAQVSEVD